MWPRKSYVMETSSSSRLTFRLLAFILSLFMALALSACDGGGGGESGGESGGDGSGSTAPVAANDSISLDEDASIEFTLSATDPNDDTLSFAVFGTPSHGDLSCDAVGSCVYTPVGDYNGTDLFTFRANDGDSDSNTATVDITVNPMNDPPLAGVGSDQVVNTLDSVTLDGSTSSDIDGDGLIFDWKQTSGIAVTLNLTDPARPTFSAPWDNTILGFTLSVGDGTVASPTVTVNVKVNDNNPPAAATSFSAVSTDQGRQLRLSWIKPAVTDLAGVKIMRKTGSKPTGPFDGAKVDGGLGSTVTDYGVSDGVTYYYAAFAYDEVPNFSAPVVATGVSRDLAAPGDVINLTTQPGPHEISLGWTNPSDTDLGGVLVSRGLSTARGAPTDGKSYLVGKLLDREIIVFNGPASTFTDTGLTPLTNYYYRVFTYDTTLNYATGARTVETALFTPGVKGWNTSTLSPADYVTVFKQKLYTGTPGTIAAYGYALVEDALGDPLVNYYTLDSSNQLALVGTTNAPATSLYSTSQTVSDSKLYRVGGGASGTCMCDSWSCTAPWSNSYGYVSFATISSDGTLSTWSGTSTATQAAQRPSLVAHGGYLYKIGGHYYQRNVTFCSKPPSSTYEFTLNTVEYAPINSDGTLGAWTATTTFPNTVENATAIGVGNRIYVFGGRSWSSYDNKYIYRSGVRFAEIQLDGGLGPWIWAGSGPSDKYYYSSGAVARKGYAYVVGGFMSTAYNTAAYRSTNVYYARIKPDGTLDPFVTTTAMPAAAAYRYDWATFVLNNKLLVPGLGFLDFSPFIE